MAQNLGQSLEDLIDGGDETSAKSKLASKLTEITLKEKEQEAEKKAASLGLSYVNLVGFPISSDALTVIAQEQAEQFQIICFFNNGAEIRIGAVEYNAAQLQPIIDDAAERFHAHVSVYIISKYSFEKAIKLYDTLPKIIHLVGGVEITEEAIQKFDKLITSFKDLNAQIREANITDTIVMIMATALKSEASDIHIEGEEKGIVVRIRVDGVLHDAAKIDKDRWSKIIARLKVLARVKININDKPQDGRFTVFLTNDKLEIRTSFLPTAYGESVVMRLLHSNASALRVEDLGLLPQAEKILEAEIIKPNGLILTAGPTGSGKTTTLYAILNKLNKPDVKVITLEDPIEYRLPGINQSQVDPSKDYTFAKGLRSLLRQDPDIVMVGEIRDQETADIAIQASLTGHLVLTTVHTNDAAGVIPRLLDMGIKPFFMTPAINAIIGQRLVRILCPKCKKPHLPTADEHEKLTKIIATISPKSGLDIPSTLPPLFEPGPGCEFCKQIGYKGRTGIYEIFTMTDAIKSLTMSGAASFEIMKAAIENGMITMLQDGIYKALQGTTDLQEVFSVIGKFDYVEDLYNIVISQTIGRGITISESAMKTAGELAKNITKIKAATTELIPKDLIELVIATALKSDAGDIHLEPTENMTKVRFRIDGILHDIIDLSKEQYLPLLSNIKMLAGMPTNIKRAAWDGRFGIFTPEAKLDSRVSIISGGWGETVVIRLLATEAAALKITDLGMREYTTKPLLSAISKTRGIIVTTGPTGSGKTTTLYALLNQLNKPDIKIITIEDPIEYHLAGILQTQINEEEGYTFALAMRSLLRQNPNIIMIGEIRDQETAKTAIEASLTGHLVLSTIHTNSAAGAIPRFNELGIDRNILASSIEASIGQRLVRKLCEHCKKPIKLDEKMMAQVKEILAGINQKSGITIPKTMKFFGPVGCEKCGNIGYKGRLGIYEVIPNDSLMQKMIQKPDSSNIDIETLAQEEGAILMMQDGVLKAIEGATSLEEVFRVAK